MLPPQQTYPDLPVYIEDQYVVRLPDNTWASVHKTHINTLH